MVFCVMSQVMLFSKKKDFVREIKKRDRDVFMGSKMMIFKNNKVWERWVVVL